MSTLFKVMSSGIDWHAVVIPLSEIGWLWVALFTLYVSFVHFALLNAVTGVFCQSAIEGAQYDKDLVVHELLANKQLYINSAGALFRMIFDENLEDGTAAQATLEAFEANLTDEAVQ